MVALDQLAVNFREAINSIRENKVRAGLTISIIGIGIMALVGILTSLDGIKMSVTSNLSKLGSNTIEIYRKGSAPQRRGWSRMSENAAREISVQEAKQFLALYPGMAATFNSVTGNAEASAGKKKTNPNCQVLATTDIYLQTMGYAVEFGRDMTKREYDSHQPYCLLGNELATTLFNNPNTAVGQTVRVLNNTFSIIGVIKKQGGTFGGGGPDRMILVPLQKGLSLRPAGKTKGMELRALVPPGVNIDYQFGEVERLMRAVRKDRPGSPDSFEMDRDKGLAQSLDDIGASLQMGGLIISLITLLGASIGLMNIMIVSVTERTREIGIRKSLGATSTVIQIQFLGEAVFICVIGGLMGVILGIMMGNAVANLVGLGKLIIPWTWVGLGLFISSLVGLLSGWYPSKMAARLDPTEALRYE